MAGVHRPRPRLSIHDVGYGWVMNTRAENPYADYFAELEKHRQVLIYRWNLAKQTTWLILLTGGYLVLYLLDLLYESFSLLGVHF